MKYKRIAALLLTVCTVFSLAGCGKSKDDSGSGAINPDTLTMQQIYKANTLEAYEKGKIQPSFTTCLREGEEKDETNSLLTLYFDDTLGLVARLRREDVGGFRFFFNQDGTNFSCEKDEDNDTILKIMADDPEQNPSDLTYPEELFQQHSFGEFNRKEKITFCSDSGDTYHIITDISDLSFKDTSGCSYIYTTQEYDVEKKTLRIIDTFRTYTFIDSDGSKKECTFSRCMTYGSRMIDLPDFMVDEIREGEWDRTITLETTLGKNRISVPNNVSVLVDPPDGYEVYTNSRYTRRYRIDLLEDGTYPDRTIYMVKK